MSPVVSIALGVICLVAVLGLVVALPRWAERTGGVSRRVAASSKRAVDGTLARIDMAQFAAQQQLVSARERQRRNAWMLRQKKREEKQTTKALELAHRAQIQAQRSEEKMDEYRRAQARKRGRLAATVVMLVGVVAVVAGVTVLRGTSASVALIVGGAVLAMLALWMLAKIAQVAAARRAAIAAGEGVFVTRGSKVAVSGDVVADVQTGVSSDAAAATADNAAGAAPVGNEQVAAPVATVANTGRQGSLTHAGARAAALAEAERLGLVKHKSAGAGVTSAKADGAQQNSTEDLKAVAEAQAAEAKAKADAAAKAKAELAAASDAALEKLRQAEAAPEVSNIEETLAEKSEVDQLRGASLDAIMRNRRLG